MIKQAIMNFLIKRLEAKKRRVQRLNWKKTMLEAELKRRQQAD